MRMTWRGLELPTRVDLDKQVSTGKYGLFRVEPFEHGFGTTIGNSLRRVLLSSLEGAAVTNIKVAGADHEFTSLPGVKEDITEIVLNVKNLIIRKTTRDPRVISVSANKIGVVTAAQIECDPSVEIINKDAVLVTLTENVKFSMEMVVETGRGYSAAIERLAEEDRFEQEIGRIEIDAIYSPVVRVRYKTEDTRVGQKTNYDRLILEIWTNGSITPEMAMVESGKILRKHINPFVQYFELGDDTAEEAEFVETQPHDKVDDQLEAKLKMSIQELELSVRASNCLEASHIETVGQLVSLSEANLLKLRSFGKTSLREITRKLADMGLSLGMNAQE
ncbi:MAG TPA: DNA-directed RNA polymerase subunit alpha [Phycisphaerales bacterium]|nr:MAG: DNA-directed RNA polymerase subunit alpha [Planctomycetes bacterium GWC2_45_44]HBG78866.1 DNA-directed RNA polymerase subunit alpha [Phycisphaerales bacterium]HBR20526.1 DNA-directed RNA polymerase subunit alpha [Phycisphaerales bacterium]